MNDLPSRKAVHDDFLDLGARSGPVSEVVQAYAEDRLVDREAVDTALRWIIKDEAPSWPAWKLDYVIERLAAAIGDTG